MCGCLEREGRLRIATRMREKGMADRDVGLGLADLKLITAFLFYVNENGIILRKMLRFL